MGIVARLLLLAVLFCAPGFGQMRLTCPQTATGAVKIQASAPFGTATVNYSIGSLQIGTSQTAPYDLDWNSVAVIDGTVDIQAVARDAIGQVRHSGTCRLSIRNHGATLDFSIALPEGAWSGVIDLALTGFDPAAYPAVWTLNVDGEEQQTVWTDNAWKSPNSVTFHLDTTRFANGPHEVHISMNSRTGPSNPRWVDWRAMLNRVVTFQNGKEWMDVVPSFSSVVLRPGETISIGCRRVLTDGSFESCHAPAFHSESSVAEVDREGNVHGMQEGWTRIHLGEGQKEAIVPVWVTADARVPHFAGNGEFLRGYQPGKSLFVIAPFFLDSNWLKQDAGLLGEVKRAAVNTLGFGIYTNPRDVNKSWQSWQNEFDGDIGPKILFAKSNGFHVLFSGDDMFRRIGEDAWFTLNWASGKRAVQYAAGKAAASGVAVGIEGIDEGSMIWGKTPAPQGNIGAASYLFDRIDCGGNLCTMHWPANPLRDGAGFALRGASAAGLNTPAGSLFHASESGGDTFSFTPATPLTGSFDPTNEPGLEFLWFSGARCAGNTICSPSVPNDALQTVKTWISAVPGAPPVTFPALGVHSATVQANWMGAGGISDYASHYFSTLKTRTTYPWSEGIQEMTASIGALWQAREPLMMLDRPQLFLISLSGPSYIKRNGSDSAYNPATDDLDQPGVSPQHVSALMMTAASLGAAGTRLYYFEPPSNVENRVKAPVGASMQTGANPTNIGQERWRAMGLASNLLTRVLEPFLFGSVRNAPAFGRNIASAVRESDSGMMLLIVNGNDWPRTIEVNLGTLNSGAGAARYRLTAERIQTDDRSGATSDLITLEAGESVAYVFPKSGSLFPIQRTDVGPGTSVRYGYIYPDLIRAGAVNVCDGTCKVDWDARLGDLSTQLISVSRPLLRRSQLNRSATQGSR